MVRCPGCTCLFQLLLHNKSPQNWLSSNNHFIMVTDSVSQEFRQGSNEDGFSAPWCPGPPQGRRGSLDSWGLETSKGPSGWVTRIAHHMACNCQLSAGSSAGLLTRVPCHSLTWQSQGVLCSYMEAVFPWSEHHKRTWQTFFHLVSFLSPLLVEAVMSLPRLKGRDTDTPPLNRAKEYIAIVFQHHCLIPLWPHWFFIILGIIVRVSRC